MNSCEYTKCPDWDGQKCTDPAEYVNTFGEPVCKLRDDAMPKADYDAIDTLTKQRDELLETLKMVHNAFRENMVMSEFVKQYGFDCYDEQFKQRIESAIAKAERGE